MNRRFFLQGTGIAAATAALSRWTRVAHAASTARYAGHRSIVGVFLLGGNDGNQLLVPRDARYAHYAAARPTIKLAKAELLAIPVAGETAAAFGLHPAMTRLRAAFTAPTPTASLVMNVGPVARPTLRADYLDSAALKPTNLFSHSDQQDAWASAVPVPGLDATHARTGWGGRTGDAIESLNPLVAGATYPPMTLVGGRRQFAMGAGLPLITNSSGDLSFEPDPANDFFAMRREKLAEIADTGAGALHGAYGDVLATSTAIATERSRARAAAWAGLQLGTRDAVETIFTSPDATWSLPPQLFTVVKDIVAGATAAGNGLGLRRQVFSVGLGGFDTHTNQRVVQDGLFEQLDWSLDAFRRAIARLGADPAFGAKPPQSTLFTMSDFARTFTENSDGGTDHAWGNHMIVMGSRVDGGKLWGTFPNVDPAVIDDSTDTRGRWLPTTSVEQYVTNLALWLGVNSTELAEILPNQLAYREAAIARGLDASFTRMQLPLMLAD
jgi:uncharacterized protein (DUF1501 family)